MGLSSKHVISSDRLDWSQTLLQSQTLELQTQDPSPIRRQQQQQQNNQQQSEPLKCPRCESTNTKFCYYNNYNKSQPRHFCKTCKRHWTKGGSLRNVPVGGGRKNKRLKTSKSNPNNAISKAATGNTINGPHQLAPQQLGGVVGDFDQKGVSNVLYQALNSQPSSSLRQDSISSSYLDSTNNLDGVFMSSALSLPPNQSLSFPYSISGSSETIPCPIPTSFEPTNVYNYNSGGEAMEESTITTFMPSTSRSTTWQVANASNGMDYWNLDDIANFVSTDLNISWDDPTHKP